MNLTCIILAVICDLAAVKNAGHALYSAGERFSVTGHVISVNAKTLTVTFWNCPTAIKF